MLHIKRVLLLAFGLGSLLVIAALLVSGGSVAAFHTLDTGSYIPKAQDWAATGRFNSDGLPEIVRTPGYPLLLLLGCRCHAGGLPGVHIGRAAEPQPLQAPGDA